MYLFSFVSVVFICYSMTFLELVTIILFLFTLGSESCGRRPSGQNGRRTANPSISTETFTATTPCSSNRKCFHFDKEYNQSVLIFSACAPFLNGSCVFGNPQVIRNLSEMENDRLRNIANNITKKCHCKNRSTEIFCRYFLPQCLPSQNEQTCTNESLCGHPDPVIKEPCRDYCNKLLNR